MKSPGKYVLVIAMSIICGVTLFLASFIVLDFVWTHIVVRNPQQLGMGDGVAVVGGGFILGLTLGLTGLIYVLYRFWPSRERNRVISGDKTHDTKQQT